eukprot:TRINITY_DN4413_c0_g2_i3.p1 TRINITY_DN4413_c0_g2~~TRINITY_DN4413_c0_g2_i3.p1  ORF type:complete len:111 (-),score=2.29 TRINITY_DN4413_c0_g2_i3:17-349(-)
MRHDRIQNILILFVVFGCDKGANREHTESVMHRKSAIRRVFASGEGEGIGSTLTLGVDVDARHLVDENIDEGGNLVGVSTKDGGLLAKLAFGQILVDFVEVVEGSPCTLR